MVTFEAKVWKLFEGTIILASRLVYPFPWKNRLSLRDGNLTSLILSQIMVKNSEGKLELTCEMIMKKTM